MTEKRRRYDSTYDAKRPDTLISIRGTKKLDKDINDEAERLNISKRDMLELIWETYSESTRHPNTKPAKAIEEAYTNLAFKMICGGIDPRLSNKEIVEIIELGSEETQTPLENPVTKSQVEKWKSSLNRVKNVTGNNRGGKVPMYKEMPQNAFNAFVTGLTLYSFRDPEAIDNDTKPS